MLLFLRRTSPSGRTASLIRHDTQISISDPLSKSRYSGHERKVQGTKARVNNPHHETNQKAPLRIQIWKCFQKPASLTSPTLGCPSKTPRETVLPVRRIALLPKKGSNARKLPHHHSGSNKIQPFLGTYSKLRCRTVHGCLYDLSHVVFITSL